MDVIPVGTTGDLHLVAHWDGVSYAINYELAGGNWDSDEKELVVNGDPYHTLSTNSNGSYGANYKTSLFLWNNVPSGIKWTYKWVIRHIDLNLYEVIQYGASIEPTKFRDGDYLMCIHDDSSLLSTTEKVRNEKVVGMHVVITGDVTTGICDLSFYEADKAYVGFKQMEHKTEYYTAELPYVLPTPKKLNNKFLGWFDEADNQVTEITAGTTGEINLTAKWQPDQYSISYTLDGGEWPVKYQYANHAEVVADFVKDFNAQSGRVVATDGSDFFDRSWIGEGSLGYKFLTDPAYSAKWSWLLQLINDKRVARGKPVMASDDDQSVARGEIHNFLNLNYYRTDCSDYSSLTFEEYAPKYLDKEFIKGAETYLYGQSITLPTPVKPDYKFVGWYDDLGNKVDSITETTSGDLILVAHWESVGFTITYNYTDGTPVRHIAETADEFWNYFFHSFYNWTGSTEKFEDFKARHLASWSEGDKTEYELYKQKGKGVIDDGFFINSSAHYEEWMPFINALDKVVNDVNPAQYAWTDTYTGLIRLANFIKGGIYYVTPARTKMLIESVKLPTELITKYKPGESFKLVDLECYGKEFLGWFDDKDNKIEAITSDMNKDLVLHAKFRDLDVYNLTWVLNGGATSEVLPDTILEGETIILPTSVTKVGSLFLGWTTVEGGTDYITKLLVTGDTTFYANWEEQTNFTITYNYTEGTPAKHFAATEDEFWNYFFQSFYEWSGSTEKFEDFKANNIKSWENHSDSTYGLYLANGKDKIDDKYFVNSTKYHEEWMPFLNALDKAVNDINNTAYAWSSKWTGLLRLSQFIQRNQTFVTDERVAWITNSVKLPSQLITSYTLGSSFKLVGLECEGKEFLGWFDNEGNKVESITAETTGNLELTAKWSEESGEEDVINSIADLKTAFLAAVNSYYGTEVAFDTAKNFESSIESKPFMATTKASADDTTYDCFWNVPENREKFGFMLTAIKDTIKKYPSDDPNTVHDKTLAHLTNAADEYWCASPDTIQQSIWYFLNGKNHGWFGFIFADGHNEEWIK